MVHIWEEREGNRDCYNLYEDLLNQSLRVEWTCGKVPGSFFASEIFLHFAEILDAWGRPRIPDLFRRPFPYT
jgi:hypothetical protein